MSKMSCQRCQYVRRDDKTLEFTCTICGDVHLCGPDVCNSTVYNTDYTNICNLTGMCFEQRMCDNIIDSNRGISNTVDQQYFHKIKRNQQIKNSMLEREFVHDLFAELDYYNELGSQKRIELLNKILYLWKIFISEANKKAIYVHRKDKRCFVVAIMFGLPTGISCSMGYVVLPHKNIKLGKLNKKKNYSKFNVSDVRQGQKLIMQIFDSFKITTPISI